MPRSRYWTPEELELLSEKWGTESVGRIAARLRRSENAVKEKAYRLGLGAHLLAGNGIPLLELCRVIYGYAKQSDGKEKARVWMCAGLPVYYQRVRKNQFLMVRIDRFWQWAEQHQELINLSRLEENLLGIEPAWARKKRRIDQLNPVQWKRPWTPEEDDLLRALLAEYRLSYFELAQRFNRSENAVRRRIYDLGFKAWPIRAKPRPWTREDVGTLARMRGEGYAMKVISQRLGRSESACRGMLERLQKEVAP